MKIVSLALSIGLALGITSASAQDCVYTDAAKARDEIKNSQVGPELLSTTYFLPAGASADFILKEPYRAETRYLGLIESRLDDKDVGKANVKLNKNAIAARPVPENHAFVKRGLADKSDTLITMNVPSAVGSLWEKARVYIYACQTGGERPTPKHHSALTLPTSSTIWSGVLVWAFLAAVYLFAAVASKAVATRDAPWFRYLDPILMTAGSDGKGSLAKLQIIFFSMIVCGLLAYIVLRTGVLSDISATVLMLLGIAAVGSAAAKATDVKRNRIDFENWAWFIRKGWLPPGGLAAVNNAKLRDIVTSDGEFDVYRYQSCIFTLVVGGALLAAGISELASFTIPETLLGVLGLSQVVYVAGKLVSQPSFTELNSSTNALRELENKFRSAAATTPDPTPPPGSQPLDPPVDLAAAIRRAGRDKYDAYMDAAKNVRIAFESATGRAVTNADLEPSFRT